MPARPSTEYAGRAGFRSVARFTPAQDRFFKRHTSSEGLRESEARGLRCAMHRLTLDVDPSTSSNLA